MNKIALRLALPRKLPNASKLRRLNSTYLDLLPKQSSLALRPSHQIAKLGINPLASATSRSATSQSHPFISTLRYFTMTAMGSYLSSSSSSFSLSDTEQPTAPAKMSLYVKNHSAGKWEEVNSAERGISAFSDSEQTTTASEKTEWTILSWNIDMSTPSTSTRIRTALNYLESLSSERELQLDIIAFQEMCAESMDAVLQKNAWIAENYAVTDLRMPQYSWYGSLMLVHKGLLDRVVGVKRVEFKESLMGRDAVVLDVLTRAKGAGGGEEAKKIRLVTVHLESLPDGFRSRCRQLRTVAELLKEEGVSGGATFGDMNSICPGDWNLPGENGLQDLWLLCGKPETEEGHTWGYQPRCRFPTGRLDKTLVTPGVEGELEITGQGLITPHQDWVSDHYGMLATIRLKN